MLIAADDGDVDEHLMSGGLVSHLSIHLLDVSPDLIRAQQMHSSVQPLTASERQGCTPPFNLHRL